MAININLSTTLQWPLGRQIPSAKEENGIKLHINAHIEECDAWIVYQGLYRPETTICAPENVILFTYEPPGLHIYQSEFLKQFSKVVTCHRSIQHAGVIHRHQAQPWLAGIRRDSQQNIHSGFGVDFTFDDFAAMTPMPKTRLLSVLCSNKVTTEGHRRRLEFVEILQHKLGDDIDIFGYGFHPLADKWEALAPYKYHIVLENSVVEDYWTEKLADAYLGYCFPIVSGCPNLERYFSKASYQSIDISKPEAAIASIRQLLENDSYEERLNAVIEARRRVLYEYNLFSEIISLVANNKISQRKKITLKDERLFLPGGWLKPFVRPFKDAISSINLK